MEEVCDEPVAAVNLPAIKTAEQIRLEQSRGEFDWDKVAREWLEEKLENTSDFLNANVEVALYEGRGRGLRAKNKISKGDLVLVERPICFEPNGSFVGGGDGGVRPPPSVPFVKLVADAARSNPDAKKKLLNLLQGSSSTELTVNVLVKMKEQTV